MARNRWMNFRVSSREVEMWKWAAKLDGADSTSEWIRTALAESAQRAAEGLTDDEVAEVS